MRRRPARGRALGRGALLLVPALVIGNALAAQNPQGPTEEPTSPPVGVEGVDGRQVDPLPTNPPPAMQPPVDEDGSVATAVDTTQPPAPEPAPLTSDDATFLAAAIASGEREVSASRLARTAAADEEVREFAARLEREHAAANADLDALRGGSAASRVAPSAPRSEAGLVGLRTLPSTEFDAAWLRWQADEHTMAIALFERASADAAHSEAVRRAAAGRLPQLRLHAARVAELQRRIAIAD
ncbi:DUF4142 domain-containing protein [Arenimonas composti]|uniref:DUF4142 domain-containing protein n=1 Tax=Arenimonas composti TR7-09 = DSM 18010 TaxID=1121013 RepID=A0A091BEK3_9GAMM|nr:DUF4142 domain-containing protein [Arenimonas composti]KFN50171.1 hypothetical protein P873_08000 [Arenimonas composti TR7-09 = DSM 18010]